MRWFLMICALSLIAGCGARVMVDGYNLKQKGWERDREAILRKASFDMQCPSDQLTLTVLDTFDENYARQVGVRGCGRQATYVDPQGNYMWVANTESTLDAQ